MSSATATRWIPRESVSLDMMKRSEIDTTKVEHGVDTASARIIRMTVSSRYAVQHWLDVVASRKPSPLPVNCSSLINASARPVRRTEFADVVNRVLDSGYQVLALSTCTGIDAVTTKMTVWWRSTLAHP